MAYQFIHAETYGLQSRKTTSNKVKRTAGDVIAEATRIESHCKHVDNPKRPSLVFGEDPRQVLKYLAKHAPEAKDRTGKKKLASDAQILLAGVISAPIESAGLISDLNAYEASKNSDGAGDPRFVTQQMQDYSLWRKKSMDFLKETYGEKLKSVVMHTDEKFVHFHFYCRNDFKNGTLNLDGLDVPGDAERALKLNRNTRNANGGQRRTARANALKAYQDSYFKKVAQYLGWARLGPRSRRMKHVEWVTEQKKEAAKAQELLEASKRVERAEKKNAELSMRLTLTKNQWADSVSKIPELESEIYVLTEMVQRALQSSDPRELQVFAAQLANKKQLLQALKPTR